MNRDVDTVARPHGIAVARIKLPREEALAAHPVRRAQRLDRRRERHHRKLGDQVEPDGIRRRLGAARRRWRTRARRLGRAASGDGTAMPWRI
jgi:hypothetical protein